MDGGGGVSPADEQLVARFSGRLEDRVGRFLGRPQVDQWVWDPTWLKLVRSSGGSDCAGDGYCVVVEWGAGVQDVVAGLDGDAAVAA